MQPVNVGLLGLGTVGAGAVNLLERNGVEITRRAGREIRVVRAAVRNPDKPRECATAVRLLTREARRLRYRDDDKRVEAPPIEPDGYHIFLSHVWSSGQDQAATIKRQLQRMLPGVGVFLGQPL